MDLLERARTLAACPLFEGLAPAVIIRLAERARATQLERGERRTTENDVWVVASGSLAVGIQELASAEALATASVVRKHGSGALPGLAARATERTLEGTLFEIGTTGDAMFIVTAGALLARRAGAPDRRIEVGGVVGELAVLTHGRALRP